MVRGDGGYDVLGKFGLNLAFGIGHGVEAESLERVVVTVEQCGAHLVEVDILADDFLTIHVVIELEACLAGDPVGLGVG